MEINNNKKALFIKRMNQEKSKEMGRKRMCHSYCLLLFLASDYAGIVILVSAHIARAQNLSLLRRMLFFLDFNLFRRRWCHQNQVANVFHTHHTQVILIFGDSFFFLFLLSFSLNLTIIARVSVSIIQAVKQAKE